MDADRLEAQDRALEMQELEDLRELQKAVLAHAKSSLVPHSAEWDDALENIYALAGDTIAIPL